MNSIKILLSRCGLVAVPLASAWLLSACDTGGNDQRVALPDPSAVKVHTLVEPGKISTGSGHESPCAISPDGSTFYFTRADADFETSTIYVMRRDEDGEAMPAPVRFTKGDYAAGVSINPAQNQLLYTSKDPTELPEASDEWNVWMSTPIETRWQPGAPLPYPVNSNAEECCGVFMDDERFYFSSKRDGSWDIFEARLNGRGQYTIKKLPGAINSEHDEWPSHYDQNRQVLLFSSIRPEGMGGDDIYLAWNLNGEWSEAEILDAPVNSASYEDSAFISPNGETLYWSSWRSGDRAYKQADVYSIELAQLGQFQHTVKQHHKRPKP